jgi:hypothetical protein
MSNETNLRRNIKSSNFNIALTPTIIFIFLIFENFSLLICDALRENHTWGGMVKTRLRRMGFRGGPFYTKQANFNR